MSFRRETRLFRPGHGGAVVRGWPLFGPQSTPTLWCGCVCVCVRACVCEWCPTNQALCEALRRLNLRRVFAAKVIIIQNESNEQRLKYSRPSRVHPFSACTKLIFIRSNSSRGTVLWYLLSEYFLAPGLGRWYCSLRNGHAVT